MMISAYRTFCAASRSSRRRVIRRVIGGRAQALADGAEGLQEGVEIGILVERAKLLERRGGVQFVQCFGLHRTFQVQMQLGFGHLQQEIVHT